MIPSITPEEMIRLQNLAERILQYAAEYPEVVTSKYVQMSASILIGVLPAFPENDMPNHCNPGELGTLKQQILYLCSSMHWAAYWGASPEVTRMFSDNRTGPAFNIDNADETIALIEQLRSERPITT